MKRTKPKWSLLALGSAAMAACVGIAQGQSVDSLLDKLVDKGILTLKEAQELREESGKDSTRTYTSRTGLPEWVTALKISGDFRLRFDGTYSLGDEIVDAADKNLTADR